MLERAVGIDPSYAPVWEALGLRYYFSGAYGNGGDAMLKRSDTAMEHAMALDPNLMSAVAWMITKQTDRGDTAQTYAKASALVQRRPKDAMAHFALSYVLRYAGLLQEAAQECDTALALDRTNFQLRSCSGVFAQLGQEDRAMEFVRLDAGSEYAAMQTAVVSSGPGKAGGGAASAQGSIGFSVDGPRVAESMPRPLAVAIVRQRRSHDRNDSARGRRCGADLFCGSTTGVRWPEERCSGPAENRCPAELLRDHRPPNRPVAGQRTRPPGVRRLVVRGQRMPG